MSDLETESIIESHQILFTVEHELVIIINTVHFSLYCFYILYEILNYTMFLCGYPRLPTYSDIDDRISARTTQYIEHFARFALVFGAWFGVQGAANWKLRYTLISCIICTPFAFYDTCLAVFSEFHKIKVNDFLLFQTLLTSTARTARIFATLTNVCLIFHSMTRPMAPLLF